MEDICIYDGDAVISRIVFGHGLSGVAGTLADCTGSGKTLPVYMIYDAHVEEFVSEVESAVSGIGGLEFCGKYSVVATEEGKTMDTVLDMTGWLLENGADRNAMVLAVGGGITTDMAGFAASIYKRGVRFAYVPTTLLSQVDAAIGGKTGVNYDSYKNMIGVIRQPEFTYICPEVLETLPLRDFLSGAAELVKTFLIEDEVLETLPLRDFLSGAAELVKTFLIEDRGFYRRSLTFLAGLHGAADKTAFLKGNRHELLELVRAAASVKAGIVTRDQFETGERRKLNLGHTFAHAIEKNARMAGDDITHGEAVSMGMVMAAELSVKIGLARNGFPEALYTDFRSAGLPVDCPYPVSEL